MSATVDQKAYLQKYLGGRSNDKKKKKKKAPKGKGFKIIDDDIDLTKLRPLDGDELDILDEGEDGPQVAGIIDERPEEVKKLEQFKTSSKWRVVTQDDGFNSKLLIEEIKKDIKETEKENELVFGKMYSDSEDEKQKDSDVSPPRIRPNEKSNEDEPRKKQLNNNDNDVSHPGTSDKNKNRNIDGSVPRKGKNYKDNNSDSDISPPRKRRDSQNKKSTKNYDSDLSPPRKAEGNKNKEKPRKPSRWGAPEEQRRQRSRSDSPRRNKKRQDSDNRKSRRDSSDSDISPQRKSHKDDRQTKNKTKRDQSSESDLSPPRKRKPSPDRNMKQEKYRNVKHKRNRNDDSTRERSQKERKKSPDSDMSPPRKNKRRSESPKTSRRHSPIKRKRDSSSDLSPPRRGREQNKERHYKKHDDSPPPTNKKMEKTLEGKLAGLQDARQLRDENEAFRRREDDAFKRMTDDVSGRIAQVVSRKGKRETSEERKQQKEKAERQKILDEKYKQWSKGLKQIETENARREDFLREAAKPLARFKDDRDLERNLMDVERAGDPMLAYIKDKKRERGDLGPEKPAYKGSFPPNRFNIRPGYRWDGVDRSNGYEKKFFENQSKRKAQEEEAYKWSTEDL